MVPQTQSATKSDARLAPPPRSTTSRWPLFWRVFGAVGVSLALWWGIYAVVDIILSRL